MQRKLQEKMTLLQSLVSVAHSLGLRLNEISNIASFKQIICKVEAVRIFIESHQNVLKALRDVGEQAPSVLRRARVFRSSNAFLQLNSDCVLLVSRIFLFLLTIAILFSASFLPAASPFSHLILY